MSCQRASTGIDGLDQVLDGLRVGDNVVWQVENIDDYRQFVIPFVRQALHENRKVIYFRFGEHAPLLSDGGVKTYYLNPNAGFEAFSMRVHDIAADEGSGTFYVFDSLSDLLSAWATDLMIGNFFRVTCPYLFQMETIAYFALLRHRNSFNTIARIRETTQVMLEIYRRENTIYLHPVKVWRRYSPTMFLPHIRDGDGFKPITSSAEVSRIFARRQKLSDARRKLDYWDNAFMRAQEIQDAIENGESINDEEIQETIDMLCRMVIGRDKKMLDLARRYFSLRDLLRIRSRMIGTGFIGGKTVGMLIARNILRNDTSENWRQILEPHDSFYVGSDVYYTYVVENGGWDLLIKHKKEEHYYDTALELHRLILQGKLPDAVSESFMEVVDYYGQAPIIVRSSSLLEDNFGNAFAGKYDSIFCVNQGDSEERFSQLEKAVKQVYASTMSEDALVYRQQRGLASSDEQMALLIQRVSGSYRGRYFMPDLAGVAMSRNMYAWRPDIRKEAGMMRLVVGLGTRAVDRVGDDYPRIVPLDQPALRPESSWEDVCQFSQHLVDVLDTEENCHKNITLPVLGMLEESKAYWRLVAEEDHEASRRLVDLGVNGQKAWVLTLNKLLTETALPALMQRMLKTIENAYSHPIDIEFTVNFIGTDCMQINLLQCRPLQTWRSNSHNVTISAPASKDILLASSGHFMGGNALCRIDWVILVDLEGYAGLDIGDRYKVARLIGRINKYFRSPKQMVMLIGPGRWGTSSPSLGVPVTFAEICNFSILVEVAGSQEGYMPELSFGTHFFQDLVESQIFYAAVFPGREGSVFQPEKLKDMPNIIRKIIPNHENIPDIVRVLSLENPELWLFSDIDKGQFCCFLP